MGCHFLPPNLQFLLPEVNRDLKTLNGKFQKQAIHKFQIAKIYGKNRSSLHEIVKNKEEIHASFAVISQNAKVAAIVCDKCLVKMEKTFICKDILR